MTLTAWVIIGSVLLVGAYDVFAVLKWGPNSTISVNLYNAAKLYPVIPFAIGFLAGHVFFPVTAP